MSESAKRNDLTVDFVLKGLREVYDRSMQAVQVLDAKGVPTGEWRHDGMNANRALENIGKYLGMFIDKHEIENRSFSIVVHYEDTRPA